MKRTQFRTRIRGALLAILISLPALRSAAADAQPDSPRFERDVAPILTAHCFKCHGLESKKAELDLRTIPLMLKGGETGPTIKKGAAKESPLFERVLDRSMPPARELPLTEEQIETIRRWLDAGAPSDVGTDSDQLPSPVSEQDRQFWAFRKPTLHEPPQVQGEALVRTPIDRFLLAALEQKSLSFATEADRRTLARRVFFDLIGLPPSAAETEEFLRDSSPHAYEALVDRLLDSRHFGERWARHWLDSAGYTDTIGDDTDATIAKVAAGKWRYRDWVVRAFNSGKPYDRFLVEQLAGDELFDWRSAESYSPEQLDLLVATGFLRTAADETLQNELNTADIRHAVLQRTMETSISGLVGLTLACARCHSHKYEPIPHEDYYRLLAVFTPAYNPQSWLQPAARELPDVPPAEKSRIDKSNAELDSQVAERKVKRDAIRGPHEQTLKAKKLSALPEAIRDDCKQALETPADKRTEIQKNLAQIFEAMLKVTPDEVTAALAPDERKNDDALVKEIAEITARKRSWGTIQAVYDVGAPPATYVLRRGNHETPGAEAAPGFLRVLSLTDALAEIGDPKPHAVASGRRLTLARLLTDPQNPAAGQVARVFVNRVWQQLFGEGIVPTSENFGHSGAQPTHPELLDWLAADFIASGWQVKPLIKRMLLSSAYRQSSKSSDCLSLGKTQEAVDPSNALLWRMRLRPLEAEAIRDSLLTISGRLDTTMGGEPVMHAPRPDGLVGIVDGSLKTPTSKYRRSLYILSRRRYHLSLMEIFDQPELASNCLKRVHAPVVSQSLAMLNDAFVREQAEGFAARVLRDARNATEPARINLTFELALGRPASRDEIAWTQDLLERHRARYRQEQHPEENVELMSLTHVCQMLFNASEFLYLN